MSSQDGPRDAGTNGSRLLEFIELKTFTRRWDELAKDERDLEALQLEIMRNPTAGAVIEGTESLRKLRFAPPQSGRGKRGALRVCYVYFAEWGTILLVVVYPKNEQDDLPDAAKKRINAAIKIITAELEAKHRKP